MLLYSFSHSLFKNRSCAEHVKCNQNHHTGCQSGCLFLVHDGGVRGERSGIYEEKENTKVPKG